MKAARASVNDARTAPSAPRAAADLEDGERERDRGQCVAEGGGRLAEPEQAERPLLERSEPGARRQTGEAAAGACSTGSAASRGRLRTLGISSIAPRDGPPSSPPPEDTKAFRPCWRRA
jgi:hypothetical protein